MDKLTTSYVNLMLEHPYVQFIDSLSGIWYDLYMDAFLKMYYWPTFIAGKEDELSQTIAKMIMCKV